MPEQVAVVVFVVNQTLSDMAPMAQREAYDYAARSCDVPAEQMLLVAVHSWDIDGAARAGMATAWINCLGNGRHPSPGFRHVPHPDHRRKPCRGSPYTTSTMRRSPASRPCKGSNAGWARC